MCGIPSGASMETEDDTDDGLAGVLKDSEEARQGEGTGDRRMFKVMDPEKRVKQIKIEINE